MGQILQVNDLHVYYGSIHAVKGVSFEVNEGEVVTLIGANGAGKSTVLNTVSGLLHPKHGSVVFEGKDLKGVPAHKIVEHGLAQVPEGRHVFLQMTVEDNLEMGAYTQPNSTIEAGIADVYERFPRLKERRKQIAGTLSGGEQQMLAMGRALMSKPKLLMLDEPSMGLAPILVEQIFDIIRELHAAGTTILLVEQNAQAALSVADRATYMLYEALMPLLALAVSFLISFGVTFALNMPNMTLPLFLLLLVVGLFYPKYGKSETNNKNANTSGVVALLEVAKALTPRYRGEVCFLFLDGGTQGSKGAKRLIHAHPELKKKSVVVLDCVGEGDELLILPGKTSRWNDKLLDTILEQFSNSEKKTCFLKTDGLVHYPSDNRAFTGGTVICACKKVKGFGRCILPRKATGIDEENLSLLCDGLCKLVMYYNPQNT